MEPWWSPFALDCGYAQPSDSVACQQLASSAASPSRLTFDIAPVDLVPHSQGQAGELSRVSFLDLRFQAVNITSTAPGSQFMLLFWVRAASFEVNQTATIRSLYGWCDSSRTTLCEKVRTSITGHATHTTLSLLLHCGSEDGQHDVYASVSTMLPPPSRLMNVWHYTGVEWTANLSRVCVFMAGVPILCGGLPTACPGVDDPLNAASLLTGMTRVTFSSRIVSSSIRQATASMSLLEQQLSQSNVESVVDRTVATIDDIRLYQYQSSLQRTQFVALAKLTCDRYLVDSQSFSNLPELLACIDFDNPLGMFHQPEFVTSLMPSWFQYQSSIPVS